MTDPDKSEKDRKEPSGTTLTLEEWFEELNSCDRLHQYAKKRKQEKSGGEKREESGEERQKEPKEGTTLSTEEWIEVLNKHDSFDQYAKRRRVRREQETDDE
jgi:hypothetical protein